VLYVAVRAARRAGDLILRAFEEGGFSVQKKVANDLVTEIDRRAEELIVREIARHYPAHGIVAEEDDRRRNPDAPVQWYIDPLDGTTNFVHGYPHFSVSIAAWKWNRPLVAVIHDPVRNETFEAKAGEGAFLNRRRLRLDGDPKSRGVLFASGLPAYRPELLDRFQARMDRCMRTGSAYRRGGSAALDLAYVAAGRIDVYWEEGLMPWDIAAGILLVQEAGGIVTGIDGASVDLARGDVLAAHPRLHREWLQLLSEKE